MKHIFSTILFLSFLLSACVPIATPVTNTSIVSTSSVPSLTPLPTRSPTPLPPDPPLTPTPIVAPTLPVEEAQARLLELMANNGNCQLPCLWGIMPGKTTFLEARAILSPMSSLSSFTDLHFPGPATISPTYSERGVEIYSSMTYLIDPENGITNRIVFVVEAHRPLQEGGYEDVYNSLFFGEKVSEYSLSRVMTGQGIPSTVMIATWGAPLTQSGLGGFDILLLYPEQGILVNYTTQMYVVGENARGCPANAHVEMNLYPPGDQDKFLDFLEETDWVERLKYYRSLEEVSTMTADEFYETFHVANGNCIDTPASFWPRPGE